MSAEIKGKYSLEINFVGDGRVFLNYWDFMHGNDVVCEIINDELMLSKYDENSNELPSEKIIFNQFLELVKKSINEQ